MATPQLLGAHLRGEVRLDYIVYDYLAEITMSILARAKAKAPDTGGYATDFVTAVIAPHLREIAQSGVKIISNAGGVNPVACGTAVRALIAKAGLDLRVAVITGDDRMETLDTQATDMFTGAPFPPRDTVQSANAYLGAFPIAKALGAGADIIITGRVVDSAVTLGACIHEFGWNETDWDALASGSLCGHILECGPQATGGNFTDWDDVPNIANIGYPIAEVSEDGSFIVTKAPNTGGRVSVGTVSEQMLYEIGDPQSYLLPDVSCDFSEVAITRMGEDRVHVSPAKGRPAPTDYKTCLTYVDGFRAGQYVSFIGTGARAKAARFGEAVIARAQDVLRASNLGGFTEVSQEIIGGGSQMGDIFDVQEVVLKLAVSHAEAKGVGTFLKALTGTFLATPPGAAAFTGAGRPRPSPILRLFSYLTPKADVEVILDLGEHSLIHQDYIFDTAPAPTRPDTPAPVLATDASLRIEDLAWGRSGDKGDTVNIGIIARRADYMPALWSALTEDFIAQVFSHFLSETSLVTKFYLPGSHAINFHITAALGGGGAASLRNDAQGKAYAQILLAQSITVPADIAEAAQG